MFLGCPDYHIIIPGQVSCEIQHTQDLFILIKHIWHTNRYHYRKPTSSHKAIYLLCQTDGVTSNIRTMTNHEILENKLIYHGHDNHIEIIYSFDCLYRVEYKLC